MNQNCYDFHWDPSMAAWKSVSYLGRNLVVMIFAEDQVISFGNLWEANGEPGSFLSLGEHEDLWETPSFISICSEQLQPSLTFQSFTPPLQWFWRSIFFFILSTFFLLSHISLNYHEEFKLHYSVMTAQNSESFLVFPFTFLSVKDFHKKLYFHFLANV